MWGLFFRDDLKVAGTSDERFNFDTIFYWISILLPRWLKNLKTTPMMMMLAENVEILTRTWVGRWWWWQWWWWWWWSWTLAESVEILTRTWVGRCRPTASKLHTWLLCWLFSQLLLSLFYSSICPTFNLCVFISRMALLIFLPYVFCMWSRFKHLHFGSNRKSAVQLLSCQIQQARKLQATLLQNYDRPSHSLTVLSKV